MSVFFYRGKIRLTCFIFLIATFSLPQISVAQSVHRFELGDSVFLLDGKPFTMISGELHYPRIPREAWRDRMKMAKAMGLNTIGTYVFWNVHEPEKGRFDFSGNNDIAAFVKIAQEEGLWVVLRPSPYVCAEWEFGGYPYWLQNEDGLIVRSTEPKFIAAYTRYINAVAKQIAPLQINRGGNILMIQVENEYGFYSNDRKYLEVCHKLFVDAGFDGLLYTCDPAAKVGDGHIPGLLPAVNGLSSPDEVKQLVRRYHDGKGPYYVAEWYPAWFDWWGEAHHKVPAEKYAPKLDSLLAAGVSVNMYMFHGGTTRGFMNGANYNDSNPYEPQISSYDYDAPVDEAGNATHKFMTFRNVIKKYLPATTKLPSVPEKKKAIAINNITLTETVTLFDFLPAPVVSPTPKTFEDLGQAYGFVLYRTNFEVTNAGYLKVDGLRDYAVIFLNQKRIGVLDRRLKQDSVYVDMPKGKYVLDILVENMGRVNFGPYLLKNKKGITEKVTFGGNELQNWKMFSLPFHDLREIKFNKIKTDGHVPVLKKGYFQLQEVGDTYLNFSEWGKGVAWVNGHNLGRYWAIGPQQTVYVPKEWLHAGKNEVVILELLQSNQNVLHGIDKPILDQVRPVSNSQNSN